MLFFGGLWIRDLEICARMVLWYGRSMLLRWMAGAGSQSLLYAASALRATSWRGDAGRVSRSRLYMSCMRLRNLRLNSRLTYLCLVDRNHETHDNLQTGATRTTVEA